MNCWLAEHGQPVNGRPLPPCKGQLVRVHLIPRQLLKREFGAGWQKPGEEWRSFIDLCDDPRSWVPACGGPMGNGGHHGMLDHSRTLKVPREALPAGLVEFADELGIGWWLEREYGS